MKKVAIVTWYGEYNFGNKLQNYAVEYLLAEAGGKPTTIVTSMYQSRLVRLKCFVVDMMSIIPLFSDRRLIKHGMMRKRINMVKRFSDQHLHCSERVNYRDKKELNQLNDEFDLFVSGSDQVWGSFIDEDDGAFAYYFLLFADAQKRGTLAPSLGRDFIPDGMKEKYCEAFKGIRWLSCRENRMKDLIAGVSGRKAQLMLDPTMAVPAEVWRKMERKPTYPVPDHFILDYRLGTDKDNTDLLVKRVSTDTDLEVVNIYDTETRNKVFGETGPQEFLWLIDHADVVLTDSFHGCVFSILFNVNFLCIDRLEKSQSVNMSDRLNTLLSRFGLKDRLFDDAFMNGIFNTDYASVKEIVAEEASKTRVFIQTMME